MVDGEKAAALEGARALGNPRVPVRELFRAGGTLRGAGRQFGVA